MVEGNNLKGFKQLNVDHDQISNTIIIDADKITI